MPQNVEEILLLEGRINLIFGDERPKHR